MACRNNFIKKAELKRIADQVASILGENFLGFYIYGSMVMGVWNPEKSDIDFLAITRHSLNKEENFKIQLFHEMLSKTDLGSKLEGDYVDLDLLQRKNFNRLAGTVKEGKFTSDSPCQVSADNILCLIQHGECLSGMPIRKLYLKVSKDELKDAVKTMLEEDKEKLDTAEDFDALYSLLVNSLRCIYTLETNQLPTKRTAAEYGRKLLGKDLYQNVVGFMEGRIKNFRIDKAVLRRIMDYGWFQRK